MSGADVKRLQRDVNARFERWQINTRISEDGEYGPTTRHAAQQVLLGLGIAPGDYEHGITPRLRGKLRNPRLRTPAEVQRARGRKAYLAKLRKRAAARGALRVRAYAEARRMLELDVRESGNNGGPIVMKIIKANGGGGPEAWCGDFMAWCYRKAGSRSVTRAWASVSSYLAVGGLKRTTTPEKGDLVRYTFSHIGMFVCWCDAAGKEVGHAAATHIKTIEGNTGRVGAVSDSAGGGDGIYLKLRPRNLVLDFVHVTR
jgi:hypothetical protein